jgi:hypothetical protein
MAIKTIGPSNGSYLETLHSLAVYDRPIAAPVLAPDSAGSSVPAYVSMGIKSDGIKPKINDLLMLGIAASPFLTAVGLIIFLAGALLFSPPIAAALGLSGLILLVTQVYIITVGMICIISSLALIILYHKIDQ